ncbi:MAG: hypothetical protein LBK72_10470 [Bifidobacteriaceae bacterium]|nr:hypothetical protein [Bifidobacteriaceae bacterium]
MSVTSQMDRISMRVERVLRYQAEAILVFAGPNGSGTSTVWTWPVG